MADPTSDPRLPLDPRIDTPDREGLTGTAPANLYGAFADREEITIAPDFRPTELQPAWRQDFPIDWPQDAYVERRDFLKFLVLTSFAMMTGQFWIAGQNWLRHRRGVPPIRRIGPVRDLAIGSATTFHYPGQHDPCVLVRTGDAAFVAYSQKCTHLSCAVIPRPAEGVLHCPCHNGFFDLPTGRPLAGPPTRPLPRILLEIRGADLYATGIEWRTT
jgi:nitrite reductase/ring-hydroxylating ferredoxin subunit